MAQQVIVKDVLTICCAKIVLRGASADGWGEAVLGEVGRLQGDCVSAAVESHLVFQATWDRH